MTVRCLFRRLLFSVLHHTKNHQPTAHYGLRMLLGFVPFVLSDLRLRTWLAMLACDACLTGRAVFGMMILRVATRESVLAADIYADVSTVFPHVSKMCLVHFCQRIVGSFCTPAVSITMNRSVFLKPEQLCHQSRISAVIFRCHHQHPCACR